MLADRFELYACGMEIANGCTELTDPDEQRRRMETQGAVDHDLIRALELGMPPTAGCGIGVDRLCMLLLGATSIDQVMALPL
jgi:lysyl-tRNA synthetase class 2